MFKAVLTHEIKPDKLAAMKDWCKRVDAQRKANSPSYTPMRRWISVYGNVFQFMIELEREDGWPTQDAYADAERDSLEAEFLQYIVPGKTELRLYRQLEIGS